MLLTIFRGVVCIAAMLVACFFLFVKFRKIGPMLNNLECIALSCGSAISLCAFIAAVLAIAGQFHLLSVLGLLVIGSALPLVPDVVKGKRGERLENSRCAMKKIEYLIIPILVLASILYLAFPTYYLWSGRDFGAYMINAIHTAETNSSRYETDEFLNEHYKDLDGVIELGYPALFSSYDDGVSDRPGDINAQFTELYWCILAVGYAAGGLEALVRVTAIISIVSLLLFYCFIRRYFGIFCGLFSTFLLTICPAQIWGARITQSEQLSQMLFFLMVYCFAIGWKEEKSVFLHVAAFYLGLNCFCRIDNYLMGLGILLIAIYAESINYAKRKTIAYNILQYCIWVAATLFLGFKIHAHYFIERWEERTLTLLLIGNIILLLVCIAIIIFKQNHINTRKQAINIVKICLSKKYVIYAIVIAYYLICIFGYYLRPILFKEAWDADALRQFSFYFCPIILVYAGIGLGSLLYCDSDEKYHKSLEPIFFFFIVGVSQMLLYFVKPSITMDHFFMSRRWIPVNLPFLFVLGVCGIEWLYRKGDMVKKKSIEVALKICAIVLAMIPIVYLGQKDTILMKGKAYEGLENSYQNIVARIPEDAIVLTEKGWVSAAFRYIYHRNVYQVLSEIDTKQLSTFLAQNDNVYILGNRGEDVNRLWGIDATCTYEGSIAAIGPEFCYETYPKTWEVKEENADIYKLSARDSDSIDLYRFLGPVEGNQKEDGKLIVNNQGIAWVGPFWTLSPGEYELDLELTCETDENVVGKVQILADDVLIQECELSDTEEKQNITFVVENKAPIYQFLLVSDIPQQMICKEFKIIRK